jgi:hypothetical protein
MPRAVVGGYPFRSWLWPGAERIDIGRVSHREGSYLLDAWIRLRYDLPLSELIRGAPQAGRIERSNIY